MNKWKIVLATSAVLAAGPLAVAQDSASEQAEAAREMERAALEAERQMERAARQAEREVVDIEVEMREAESRLAEAARQVAELSTRRLPRVSGYWTTELSGRPVLGVSIGTQDDGGPVEGVEVLAVSPGGAAADAGLRAGDVITAVNGEVLSAESSEAAGKKLLDFMAGVEEGDVLDVEYLRAGKSANVDVEPRSMSPQVFAFGGPDNDFRFVVPQAPGAPHAEVNRFAFSFGANSWGDLEMVALTEDLGRYFGTEEGLLVVRAPENAAFKLRDGDVLLNIDGREPTSVSHAIRILGSYQQGETLKLRIMRDKRPQTLEIEMPDNRRGAVPGAPPAPLAPRIASRVRIKTGERAADEQI